MLRFIKTIILFFSLCSTLPAHGQLKFELNFDEGDNYVILKRNPGDASFPLYVERRPVYTGYFATSLAGPQSPSGGPYLELDGINQYVVMPSQADISLTGKFSFSVSLWLYLHSESVNGDIISADNGFVSGYRFYLEENRMRLELRDGQKETFRCDSLLPAGQWVHAGFYCDGHGDSVIFFMDGSPLQRFTFRQVIQVNTGNNCSIGAWLRSSSGPNYLKANMDRVRFFAGLDTVFEAVRESGLPEMQRPKKDKRLLPLTFQLNQNYPNPFNQTTSISYRLTKEAQVSLKIYDLLGNRICVIVEETQSAGEHIYTWNGRNAQDADVPSGIYLIRLEVDGQIQTRKMVLVK